MVNCSPTIFIHAKHHLSQEQLRFLHRGPTHISPCYMHLTPETLLDTILQQQMIPLRNQTARLFGKFNVHLARRFQFDLQMKQIFTECFSIPIPPWIQQRAHQERKLIQSIREQLYQDQLILRRTATHLNLYHLISKQDYQDQIDIWMKKTNYYIPVQQTLDELIQLFNSTLERFQQQHRWIHQDHLIQVRSEHPTKIHLPVLDFLLLPSSDVQPHFSSSDHTIVRRLADYLDQILRSLYFKQVQASIVHDTKDFIQKLQDYCAQEYCLLPSTKFVTLDIEDLDQTISHDRLLLVLNKFLHQVILTPRYEKLSLDTIEKLVALVLEHQYFIYQNQIYRFKQGSLNNLPLTHTLMNIYLQECQQPILRHVRLTDQFFRRFHTISLLTWDGAEATLEQLISEVKQTYPDVLLSHAIGQSVQFLQCYIENRHGQLFTRVYRDPDEPFFTLPYVTGHPRLIYRQWFQFALIRAAQYCSSVNDFQDERRYIEATFLVNGYSLEFIDTQLELFFKRLNLLRVKTNLNCYNYKHLRRIVFRDINLSNPERQKIIELQYLFDWGQRCQFKHKFRELWSTIIIPDLKTKRIPYTIRLASKHCFSSYSLLAS